MPTRQPTKEEFEALSKDLTEVLKKHNAEIGVISTIDLTIREDDAAEGIPSPFVIKKDGKPGDKTEEGEKA